MNGFDGLWNKQNYKINEVKLLLCKENQDIMKLHRNFKVNGLFRK